MRNVFVFMIAFAMLMSCQSEKSTKVDYAVDPNDREVEVVDVLQASAYTYLEVKENGNKFWIAVQSMEAAKGDVFHFTESMEMTDFQSKDLGRTFDKVLFVENLRNSPVPLKSQEVANVPPGSSKSISGKKIITMEAREGTVSIGELFSNKAKYDKQVIMVAGEVIKVNTSIMGRNWVHIQDGTGDDEEYDLTITTLEMVRVGDVVVFEGTIVLNKDFGSGYYYDLIMEDASVKINPVL